MFYGLPPVGTPVCLRRRADDEPRMRALFDPYTPAFYASGTAALAAALLAAIRLRPVTQPEVLIPAYACPDLVSAVVYAGARPVLVDLEPDRPWLDLQDLRRRLNSHTVAVVAVHLCGILERSAELRDIVADNGALLIEDSAQAFPGAAEPGFWSADMAILSFGRGKPVSVLGGGAVLARDRRLADALPAAPPDSGARFRQTLKQALYNVLINPRIYWMLERLPFLHLGETRFHPLEAIASLPAGALSQVAANVRSYRQDVPPAQAAIAAALARLAGRRALVDLPRVCDCAPDRRLLRYPVLLPHAVRAPCLRALDAVGLGASVLYPAVLAELPDLRDRFSDQGPFPAAESFASRIITLPVHPAVGARQVEHMASIIQPYVVGEAG